MLLHGQDHLLHRHIQTARHRLDDADVGLVRDQPVERFLVETVGGERLVHRLAELGDGNLEDLVPRHRDRELGCKAPGNAAAAVQQILVATVGMQVRREYPRRRTRLEYHGAGAIGEQHRGATVAPIGDARQGFRADDQRAPGFPAAHVLVGDRQRVHESRAGSLDTERGPSATAQTLLQQHSAVGKHQVRGRGAEGDEINVGGCDAGGIQRAARGFLAEVDRRLPVGGDVSAFDSGAGANPLIGGINHLLQVEVGDDFFGQVGASAGDTRINQLAAPCACSACAMCSVSPRRAARAAVPIAREKATLSARP